jgi:hypothetical protein
MAPDDEAAIDNALSIFSTYRTKTKPSIEKGRAPDSGVRVGKPRIRSRP